MKQNGLPVFMVIALIFIAIGCPQDRPSAQAPVTGQPVEWGKGFGGSATNGQNPQGGAATLPAAGDDTWAGGEVERGKAVFSAKCASCHPLSGEKGKMADGKETPSLKTSELTGKSPKELARLIAHGHNSMPSFMGELNRQALIDVIALLKSMHAAIMPSSAPSK